MITTQVGIAGLSGQPLEKSPLTPTLSQGRGDLRRRDLSIGVFMEKTAPDCHPKNFDVQEERPVLDIIQVMLKAWLQRCITAPPVHLGPTSHAGFDTMPQHVARNALTKFLNEYGSFRTWAHQAHVALAHVPKLWQLIQAYTPEEGPYERTAWIVFLSPHGASLTLSTIAHSAKFHHAKDRAIKAHTLLYVEHRTTRGEFHKAGHQRQHREREQ